MMERHVFRELRPEFQSVKLEDRVVGLELEQEFSANITPIKSRVWYTKEDHSLRNFGYEFVTDGPISIANVESATKELEDYLSKQPLIRNSPRTSFHVHHNVLDEMPEHIVNSILLYWLFENVLFKMCDKEREGHLFCLRLKDSIGIALELRNSVYKDNVPFESFRGDGWRYGGINLNALLKFGTLESRGLHGVHTAKEMQAWTLLFHKIISSGKKFDNPEMLMDYFYKNSYDNLIRMVFDDMTDTFVSLDKNYRDLMDENVCTVASVAYCISWDKWIKGLEKKRSKQKPREIEPHPTVEPPGRAVRNAGFHFDLVNNRRVVED